MVYKISVEIQCGPFSHISHQVTVDPRQPMRFCAATLPYPPAVWVPFPPHSPRNGCISQSPAQRSLSGKHFLILLSSKSNHLNHCFFPIPLPCPSPYKAPFIGLCFDTQKNCYSLLNCEPLKDRGNTWFIFAAPALRPRTTWITGNHPPYLKLMWERTETV